MFNPKGKKYMCKKMVRTALLMLLILLLSASLSACKNTAQPPVGITPLSAVSGMLDALKAADYTEAEKYVDMDIIAEPDENGQVNPYANMFMTQFFDKLQYTVKVVTDVDEYHSIVRTEIVAVNMLPIFEVYTQDLLMYTFMQGMPADLPLEEQRVISEAIFDETVKNMELTYIKHTVDIKVAMTDGNWRVLADDALLSALTGGLQKAIEHADALLADFPSDNKTEE